MGNQWTGFYPSGGLFLEIFFFFFFKLAPKNRSLKFSLVAFFSKLPQNEFRFPS